MFGYSTSELVHSDLYSQLLNLCSQMDMPLEGLHTETGPGVLEAAIMVDESLNAADKATLFKTFSKVLFQKMILWQISWLNGLKIILVNQDIFIYLAYSGRSKLVWLKSGKLPKTLQYFVGGLQPYEGIFSNVCTYCKFL